MLISTEELVAHVRDCWSRSRSRARARAIALVIEEALLDLHVLYGMSMNAT